MKHKLHYVSLQYYEKNKPLFRSREGKESLKRQQAYRIIGAARADQLKKAHKYRILATF
ncbi:hypothetical protein [Virgibacillus sp. DJP39]|uniref:hypothetical protein n=1 Tax=Virgibacillus sp. DJP39 TaxID=3409790 RepID=UPI003BB4DFB4